MRFLCLTRGLISSSCGVCSRPGTLGGLSRVTETTRWKGKDSRERITVANAANAAPARRRASARFRTRFPSATAPSSAPVVVFSTSSKPTATGSASCRATPSSNRNTSCCWPFSAARTSEVCRKAANYILQQQMPDGGWSNYPDGPADLSVSVKAYFALKLTGHDADAPHMRRAREVIRSPRRRGRLQQLHQVLPRAARPVPLRQLPLGAAGNDAAAALVLLQPLRHVELDAHHRRAAQHLLGLQARAATAAESRASPNCSSNRRPRRYGRAQPASRLLSWTNLLPRRRLALQADRAVAWARSAVWLCKRAAAWMREHFDGQRRPRRHLPADDLHGHLPCAASASPTTPRRCSWALQAARRSDDRGGRHAALAAVLLAGVGHGPDAERPGRRRRCPAITRRFERGVALAAGEAKCGSRATGA